MVIESNKVISIRRKAYDLTQEKLAELLNVDVTTIQNWEAGKRVGMSNIKPLYTTLGFDNILSYSKFKTLVSEGQIDESSIDAYDCFELNGVELGRALLELENELKKAGSKIEEIENKHKDDADTYKEEMEYACKIRTVQEMEIKILKEEKKMYMEKMIDYHDEIEVLKKTIELLKGE